MKEHMEDDSEYLKRLCERGVLEAGETEWIEGLLRRLEESEARNKRLREALLKVSGNKPNMSTKLRDALYE